MNIVNIYATPMTAASIAAARVAAGAGGSLEDSVAFKVFLYCPIPLLDMVAGAATLAVQSIFTNDPQADLRDVPGAVDRDWRGSEATAKYVAAVREQGRHLIALEVASLERHLTLVDGAPKATAYLAGLAGEAIRKACVEHAALSALE
ncbi:hypothetical protein [Rhodanobacter sp. FW106-PBR-LB-2-11]|uniref:hypothetical protein n=1 Tax=Rhodanobacter sp. FW106-PBR-LB-2-11 TaxID=1524463 RepID=UPI0034E4DBC8